MFHLDQVNKVRRAMVSHRSPQDSRTASSPASTGRLLNNMASSHKGAPIRVSSSLMDKPRNPVNLVHTTLLQARLQVEDLLFSTVRPPDSPASSSMVPHPSNNTAVHRSLNSNRTKRQQADLVRVVTLASSSKYCSRECKIRISRRSIRQAH